MITLGNLAHSSLAGTRNVAFARSDTEAVRAPTTLPRHRAQTRTRLLWGKFPVSVNGRNGGAQLPLVGACLKVTVGRKASD